jgi:carbon storage regulator
MLVLSRKAGQKIHIGNGIEVTVSKICGDRVRLAFAAPPEVPIHRGEVFERIQEQEDRRQMPVWS